MIELYASPRVDDSDPATRQIALEVLRDRLWARVAVAPRATRADRIELAELRRMHAGACALLRERAAVHVSASAHDQE